MRNVYRSFCACFVLLFSLGVTNISALQSNGSRWIKLTLIPDYVENRIQFDGTIDVGDSSKALDLNGLPLDVLSQWKEKDSNVWNITGIIRGGSLGYDAETKIYRLVFGPVHLAPDDRLDLILPFVNLNYAQIQPPLEYPDQVEQISRQLTNFFSYRAGDAELVIDQFDIPFTPITKRIDLVLVPLMGEALAGKTSGLRLAGQIHFEGIEGFDKFSRYCQITPRRLQDGDYRAGHLLHDLDSPSFFGPDVLNPIYQYKPTITGLRSEFTGCHYDQEQGIGEVDAVFSGRVVSVAQSHSSFPMELSGTDFPDGNYSFIPPLLFKGLSGYEIRLGKIVLAPGDTLTITVPNSQVQADNLQPFPMAYEDTGNPKIGYSGPMSFELSLPYIPQTPLYVSQFPAVVRPSVSLIEEQLGSLFPVEASKQTWVVLGIGFALLVLSKFSLNSRWFALPGWLLISIAFFYGVRGSFGLLCVATALYINQTLPPRLTMKNYTEVLRKAMVGLASFVLIAIAVFMDTEGTIFFRGLSEPDLSPLTPFILLSLVVMLFFLFYGLPRDLKGFQAADLAVLALLLLVLSLYDAFDKSLLALLILCLGGFYLHRHVFSGKSQSSTGDQENKFGMDLQQRWKLAFKNNLIPIAILILIVFAIVHELSTTFANEMQISLSPLLAPVVIPVLAFVSVFLAFASIALLFLLLYPFLPSEAGYTKAVIFALSLFLVFLFGIGTDDRLIASLPNILVGRVIYYLSVPMLIGIYFDITAFMQKEGQRPAGEGGEKKDITFQAASIKYLGNLQGKVGTLVGILSLVAPSIYAYLSSQPALVTFFSLLEKLVLLPV